MSKVTKAAPAVTKAPLYVLAGKGIQLAELGGKAHNTLQRSVKGHGKAWRANGKQATNTRAIACAAIGTTPATLESIKAKLVGCKAVADSSGTAGSYMAAFLKAGYLVESVTK